MSGPGNVYFSGAPPTLTHPGVLPHGVTSKRAAKRMLKREEYLKNRAKMNKLKRQKIAKERGVDIEALKIKSSNTRKQLKKFGTRREESECKVGVVIDMSWDHLMNQRNLGKVLKQIMNVYCINRRLKNPLQLRVTSFSGICQKEMTKNQGYENWDCDFYEDHFLEDIKSEDIVYLTSESDNVLTSLEDNVHYVIGGLVDHNAYKGLTCRNAYELGLKTARLPIDEFVTMKTRKVLTVNHVFHILTLVTEGKSWKDAFMEVLPDRKGAVPKAGTSNEPSTSTQEVPVVNTEETSFDKDKELPSTIQEIKEEIKEVTPEASEVIPNPDN